MKYFFISHQNRFIKQTKLAVTSLPLSIDSKINKDRSIFKISEVFFSKPNEMDSVSTLIIICKNSILWFLFIFMFLEDTYADVYKCDNLWKSQKCENSSKVIKNTPVKSTTNTNSKPQVTPSEISSVNDLELSKFCSTLTNSNFEAKNILHCNDKYNLACIKEVYDFNNVLLKKLNLLLKSKINSIKSKNDKIKLLYSVRKMNYGTKNDSVKTSKK